MNKDYSYVQYCFLGVKNERQNYRFGSSYLYFSMRNASYIESSGGRTDKMIEVEVEGANIKFEMSDSNEVETEYYGTGSGEIYDLVREYRWQNKN